MVRRSIDPQAPFPLNAHAYADVLDDMSVRGDDGASENATIGAEFDPDATVKSHEPELQVILKNAHTVGSKIKALKLQGQEVPQHLSDQWQGIQRSFDQFFHDALRDTFHDSGIIRRGSQPAARTLLLHPNDEPAVIGMNPIQDSSILARRLLAELLGEMGDLVVMEHAA